MGKAAKTRLFIIEKTASLFNIKGYSSTSISDITAATGLTKGSIYGNFQNKEDVIQAVYDYNVLQLVSRMDEAILRETDPLDKLYAMLLAFKGQWKNLDQSGGCPIMNAAIEADDHLHCLQLSVRQSYLKWAGQIEAIIDAGIKQGIFNKVASRKYAFLMIGQLEGGLLLSKTFRDPRHLREATTHIQNIIKAELIKSEKQKPRHAFPITQLFIHLFIHDHEKSRHHRIGRHYTTRQYRSRILGRHIAGKKRGSAHHKI